jgi:hypothetical protein
MSSSPENGASNPSLAPTAAPSRLVDQTFVGVRAKLLDVAAFLDRVERHGQEEDFRCAALRAAAAVLVDGQPERARRILEKLSDPTTEPVAATDGRAAVGAWRPTGK